MGIDIKKIETASSVSGIDSNTYDSPTPSFNIEDYSVATENMDLSAGDIVLTDEEIAVKENAYDKEARSLYENMLFQEYNKELAENYEMFCRTGQNTSGLSFDDWKKQQMPFDYWRNVQTVIPSYNEWKPSFQSAYAANTNGAKVYRNPTSAGGGRVSPVAGGLGESPSSPTLQSPTWDKASDDAFLDNSRSEFAKMGLDSNMLKCTPEEYAAGITPKKKYGEWVAAQNSLSTPSIDSAGPPQFSIDIPKGLGSTKSFENWDRSDWAYEPKRLLNTIGGPHFDEHGFGFYNGRYAVATTSTYGKVGDYVDFTLSDGTVIPCIIGDIKNQNDPGCNRWGHSNGNNIIEFMVKYNNYYTQHTYGDPTYIAHSEWRNKSVVNATNRGSIFT